MPPINPAALTCWDTSARVHVLAGATMGTTWQARMAAPAEFDAAPLHAAIAGRLGALVAEMSHWEPGSLLSRFNLAPAGSAHVLPEDFATVIDAALAVARASGGAFDPAIGRVVDMWGYGATPRDVAPSDDALVAAGLASGWQRLGWDAPARTLRQPGGLWLDLSGIAKGYAVDAVAELLAELGHAHALVEIGGELSGRGMRPDGDPWWVDLETPASGIAPLRVALHQCAVATSGDYVRGRHTIDPRTGEPVGHALAVSVVHASAMLADAWATALSVAAPSEMQSLATGEQLAARALLREGDLVREWISPALAAMMEG